MATFPLFLGLQVIRDGTPQPVVPFPCVLVLRCTQHFVPVHDFFHRDADFAYFETTG